FVGQEHVVKTLTNALALERVAHAYLFAGSRGIGKTTIARILAKAVNCEKREGQGTKSLNYEPCNQCSACVEIGAGRSLDLIEIDAASNRGIDEIRELRDGIKFSPTRLKYKVFIIDEVHQLTKEAFNALLKTLEEPPGHAIFILATTELHKVPETIISRCQHFNFHKLTIDKIVGRLAQIARLEGVKIEKQALEMIAVNADGAMRDAESLLGQMMAMQDKNITTEEVKALLGTVDIAAVIEMVNYLAAKDMKKAIAFVNNISAEGYDLGQFARSLTSYLRKMMILKVDSEMAKLAAPELTEEQKKIILEQGQKFSYEELNRLLRLFIRAESEIKSAIFPQLPLELVIVEVTDVNNVK
ncbi:MAG: DNA polymerase III subunit gamma/tau, partial [Candidatus Portnoybacteria bacterium CG_4_8_14_3_um_filter_44_10]